MYFLPWWALLACLAASAVAAYLLLSRTQAGDSRWALFALTAVAAPAVLAAAMAAAVVLSTLLSAYLWDQPRGGPSPRQGPSARAGGRPPRPPKGATS